MTAAKLWPIAIVAVLALTVGANVVILIAARDPHAPALEPDYYHKAVTWDSTLAVERASSALRWRADAALERLTLDRARLTVTLHDSAGAPLTGARVRLEAIHNLESDVRVHAVFGESATPGTYTAELPLRLAGLWELRLDATRGRDTFVTSLRRELVWTATR